MIQGLAILFFMWNVPYVFAILDPQKNRLSLWQAVIMQAIGVFGESSILVIQKTLPIITQSSLQRFIIFDAVGLILLVISLSISKTD